jgi:Excalibur calcium-binding domain
VKRFNAPPGWPPPPNVRWRPPKHWAPDESWPPAPPDWSFWINEDGRRVTGPLGRYGGPSRVWVLAAAVMVPLALLGSCQAFGGDDRSPVAAVPTTSESATDPGTAGEATDSPTDPASTGPESPEPTSATPTTPSSTPDGSPTPTATPSASPRATQPTEPGKTTATPTGGVLYKNCGAVRAAGKAPLLRGQPGYSALLDPDGDGVACERGRG